MRLQPIVDQLAGLPFKRIAGALELAGLGDRPGALPAAFVVPSRNQAGDNKLAGAIDQLVSDEFIVVMLIDSARRDEGKIAEDLHELEEAVIGRLLGWTMPGAAKPTLYGGGDLVGLAGTLLTWAVRFRTAHHLRKTS